MQAQETREQGVERDPEIATLARYNGGCESRKSQRGSNQKKNFITSSSENTKYLNRALRGSSPGNASRESIKLKKGRSHRKCLRKAEKIPKVPYAGVGSHKETTNFPTTFFHLLKKLQKKSRVLPNHVGRASHHLSDKKRKEICINPRITRIKVGKKRSESLLRVEKIDKGIGKGGLGRLK